MYNSAKGKKERVGRLLEMHANDRVDIKTARAGDIVAIAGLKDTITGETLCDEDHPIVLERMVRVHCPFPYPRRLGLMRLAPAGGWTSPKQFQQTPRYIYVLSARWCAEALMLASVAIHQWWKRKASPCRSPSIAVRSYSPAVLGRSSPTR